MFNSEAQQHILYLLYTVQKKDYCDGHLKKKFKKNQGVQQGELLSHDILTLFVNNRIF